MSEFDADIDLSSMKVSDLKKELKSRGLPVSGNKNELIERLQVALSAGSDNDIMAEANELLEDEDNLSSASIDLTAPTSFTPETAVKKKVSIRRDIQVDPLESSISEPKSVSPTEPDSAEVCADSTNKSLVVKTPVQSKKSDVERAAERLQRFGNSSSGSDNTEKINARAARFGSASTVTAAGKIAPDDGVDLDTLKKRAERFGQSPSTIVQKLELADKLQKRKERFGSLVSNGAKVQRVSLAGSKEVSNLPTDGDEKLKKRLERFGQA